MDNMSKTHGYYVIMMLSIILFSMFTTEHSWGASLIALLICNVMSSFLACILSSVDQHITEKIIKKK